ncbi:PEP-CTERM sorting domain-containing protein [Xylophilus sp. GOD-11R]|nr:PEP-CTERM sorting domain-containing protein [Xylophilus sp. GOD-11R]WPB59378.1 PEP-CTERM sorting domain-containing protein [Xylophilus sp. GOD-11R]
MVPYDGEFRGFQTTSNSISVFELKDGHVGLRSLTYAYAPVAAVPEPEVCAMLLAGLGSIGTIARRRAVRPIQLA